jgi:isoleucyl-tRNA synthetase
LGLPRPADRAKSLPRSPRRKAHPHHRRAPRPCDAFSESWIAKQTAQFQRLGVLADWKNEYKTKAPAFEADIVRTFAAFVEKGLVYRSKKPVYWSIPFETALAEAEIEYKDHVSIAIWVKFAVPTAEAEKFGLPADKPLFVVIWTTTPWTIPANLAIAVHPEVDYVVADLGAERIVVAQALLGSVFAAAKIEATPPPPSRIPCRRRARKPRDPPSLHRPPLAHRHSLTTSRPTAAPAPSTPRPATAPTTISPASNTNSRSTARSATTAATSTTAKSPPTSSGSRRSETVEDLAAKKPRRPIWPS